MKDPQPKTSTPATPQARAAGVPHSLGDAGPVAAAGVGAGAGAAAGAMLGAFAGPVGIVAGAVLGAAAGAATGVALTDEQTDEQQRDSKLDEDIGVIGGDLGAAKPGAIPAKRGTFSAGSAGAGGATHPDSAPDEGPMPHGD